MKDQLLNSIHKTFENSLGLVVNICESEIEKLFLLKIVDYAIKRPDRYSIGFILWETDTETVDGKDVITSPVNYQMPDDFGYLCGLRISNLFEQTYFEIFPQKKEEFGDPYEILRTIKYRLDFGVYKYSKHNSESPSKKYCIECDGFDYHNTKDQIKRDNERVRNLLMLKSFTTIRYLGTEIHNWTEDDVGLFINSL
ncbi:MAG: hypothetical protein DYG99_15780 [Bacteroidetes bacterium CHB5]|nr:hypothetical protein [Bacteroidetes bacterium CHB5]